MKNFAFNLTSIKELNEEGIIGITPGEWAKCVEHVVSRGGILGKGDRGRGRA